MPVLIIEALENNNPDYLIGWANEVVDKKIETVNMLGCHDGIPLLDLKGLLPDDEIQSLIDVIVQRGGYVKELHGEKAVYYQVNATYFSALGEDTSKMLLARAIQMFMPGRPQVWYLDLFCGKNDMEAVKRAGAGGHKEINRTNLSVKDITLDSTVLEQLKLIKLRNTHDAFKTGGKFTGTVNNTGMCMSWENNSTKLTLKANLENYSYEIIDG